MKQNMQGAFVSDHRDRKPGRSQRIVYKSDYSWARQRLIEMMEDIYFGQVRNLVVEARDPARNKPINFIRHIKLGGRNMSSKEVKAKDYIVKAEIILFFDYLDELENGTVELVEIMHGLPFIMDIEGSISL